MKQGLLGFGLVMLLGLVGWLVAFGAVPPCEAMQAQARKLGEAKDARSKGIAAALGKPDASISTVECIGMAVRMKALGAAGVTVIGPGAGKPTK